MNKRTDQGPRGLVFKMETVGSVGKIWAGDGQKRRRRRQVGAHPRHNIGWREVWGGRSNFEAPEIRDDERQVEDELEQPEGLARAERGVGRQIEANGGKEARCGADVCLLRCCWLSSAVCRLLEPGYGCDGRFERRRRRRRQVAYEVHYLE